VADPAAAALRGVIPTIRCAQVMFSGWAAFFTRIAACAALYFVATRSSSRSTCASCVISLCAGMEYQSQR